MNFVVYSTYKKTSNGREKKKKRTSGHWITHQIPSDKNKNKIHANVHTLHP